MEIPCKAEAVLSGFGSRHQLFSTVSGRTRLDSPLDAISFPGMMSWTRIATQSPKYDHWSASQSLADALLYCTGVGFCTGEEDRSDNSVRDYDHHGQEEK